MIIVCGWSMGDCIGCVHKRTKVTEETKEFYEIIIVKKLLLLLRLLSFCISWLFRMFSHLEHSGWEISLFLYALECASGKLDCDGREG